MSLVSQFLADATSHLHAYEARLGALRASLAPVEAVVVPDGRSVANEIDRMKFGQVVWHLLETAARKPIVLHYARSTTQMPSENQTNELALIISQLLAGVYFCFVVDHNNYEFEPAYGEHAVNLDHRERYSHMTQNRVFFAPLSLGLVNRVLLEHVELTVALDTLLHRLDFCIQEASNAAAEKRDCDDGVGLFVHRDSSGQGRRTRQRPARADRHRRH
jgi:hypothetical protein